MRIVALIDEHTVIERILRHIGLWQQGVRVDSGPDSPAELVIEPCFDDTFPACRGVAQRRRDYDTDPPPEGRVNSCLTSRNYFLVLHPGGP
jgi:hypothetical protein